MIPKAAWYPGVNSRSNCTSLRAWPVASRTGVACTSWPANLPSAPPLSVTTDPSRAVRDALHRARAEHHALRHAPRQKLIFQRDAVHLTVRRGRVDAVGASVVDDHLRLGPHLVEAVGQAEVLKLVHPHAVVVLPALERGRVDEGDAEALGGRAVRRAEARGAASDDDAGRRSPAWTTG